MNNFCFLSVILLCAISTASCQCTFNSSFVDTCTDGCDWTDSRIWSACAGRFPSNGDDVVINAAGVYAINFNGGNLTLNSLDLGYSHGIDQQSLTIRLTGGTFRITTFLRIDQNGLLHLDLNGGNFIGSSFNISNEGSLYLDSSLTLTVSNPIFSNGLISISSNVDVTISSSIQASTSTHGSMEISSRSVVFFNSSTPLSLVMSSISNYGTIYGRFTLTGSLSNGIGGVLGTTTYISSMTISGTYTSSTGNTIAAFIQDSATYSTFHISNLQLDGALQVYLSKELSDYDSPFPLITYSNHSGDFSSINIVSESGFANPYKCKPVVNNILNQFIFSFDNCTGSIPPQSSSSEVLGAYDKMTLIYFGIAAACVLVVIIIVAFVIRYIRIVRARRKNDFYTFKDEDFHDKYIREEDL